MKHCFLRCSWFGWGLLKAWHALLLEGFGFYDGRSMFSSIWARIFICSIVILCVNDPPMVMSRYMKASMSRPKQKRCNIMLSGKDKSGPACIKVENQGLPIDSLLYYLKSRIALVRESIRDIGKNARQNMSLSSSQSPFVLPTACVYHCFAFSMR